ncbi:MAG: RDD family protein [Pseudomonadota bacterium]
MEQYGGFWIRVVAYIIDAIILGIAGAVIGGILGAVIGVGGGSQDAAGGVGGLVGLVLGIAYFTVLESSDWQATVGKKAMGLIVTDTDGNKITWLRALGRYAGKLLSGAILLIGYIMIAFTERKQGLHDMLASTLVLKGEPGMTGTDPSTFE